MTPTRRALLKSGAFCLIPLPACALAGPALVVHDTRHPASAALLGAGVPTLDVAQEHTTRFATIRAGLPGVHRIDALTMWSDHVMLAHELERHGFRRAGATRAGQLWRWSMVRRA